MSNQTIEAVVAEAVNSQWPEAQIKKLDRLTGGASANCWLLTLDHGNDGDDDCRRYVVRQDAIKRQPSSTHIGADKRAEYQLQKLFADSLCPVPPVYCMLPEVNGCAGYIMGYLEGETLAGRINKSPEYTDVRRGLAYRMGQVAACIHKQDLASVVDIELRQVNTEQLVSESYKQYLAYNEPHPIFEYAFDYLRQNPLADAPQSLIHGDLRNGNLIVDTDGLQAVLDWELAHIGNPYHDLSWLCCNTWRFGNRDQIVGGFGEVQDLFAGYREAYGADNCDWLNESALEGWLVFEALRWGLVCMSQCRFELQASVPVGIVMERAAIGRRISEVEMELMLLLAPESCRTVKSKFEAIVNPPANPANPENPADPANKASTRTDLPRTSDLHQTLTTFLSHLIDDSSLDPADRYFTRVARKLSTLLDREQRYGSALEAASYQRMFSLLFRADRCR